VNGEDGEDGEDVNSDWYNTVRRLLEELKSRVGAP
jgi:hypothetical protein